jgi:hypothetical protein
MVNLPINDYRVLDLQIKCCLFPMIDIHTIYMIYAYQWFFDVSISTIILIKYLTQSSIIEEQIHYDRKDFNDVFSCKLFYKC